VLLVAHRVVSCWLGLVGPHFEVVIQLCVVIPLGSWLEYSQIMARVVSLAWRKMESEICVVVSEGQEREICPFAVCERFYVALFVCPLMQLYPSFYFISSFEDAHELL